MDIDIEQFQSEVQDAFIELNTFTRNKPRFSRSKKINSSSHMLGNALAKKNGIAAKKKPAQTGESKSKKTSGLSEIDKKELHEKAQGILKDVNILKLLCPALKELTCDFTEVIKNLTIALVPLSLSGALAIPLDPYLYAMLAFIIGKSGITTICKNHV